MLKNILVGAVVLLVAGAASASEQDSPYYKIGRVVLRDVTNGATNGKVVVLEDPAPVNPIDKIGDDVDKIINIGKKIWAVIEAGKPVMNVNTDVATALPRGVRSLQELSSWHEPITKIYEFNVFNGFDVEVIKLRYRVISVYGGNLNGLGQYIGYATVQPEDVSVVWGWSLDAQATVPAVFNTGSEEDPVGAMNLVMDYNASSVFNKMRQSQSYVITGTGDIRQLD